MKTLIREILRSTYRSKFLVTYLVFCLFFIYGGLKIFESIKITVSGAEYLVKSKHILYFLMILVFGINSVIGGVYGVFIVPKWHKGKTSLLTHMLPVRKELFPIAHLVSYFILSSGVWLIALAIHLSIYQDLGVIVEFKSDILVCFLVQQTMGLLWVILTADLSLAFGKLVAIGLSLGVVAMTSLFHFLSKFEATREWVVFGIVKIKWISDALPRLAGALEITGRVIDDLEYSLTGYLLSSALWIVVFVIIFTYKIQRPLLRQED